MVYLRARALCSKTKASGLALKQRPTALRDFLRSMNQTSEEGIQCFANFLRCQMVISPSSETVVCCPPHHDGRRETWPSEFGSDPQQQMSRRESVAWRPRASCRYGWCSVLGSSPLCWGEIDPWTWTVGQLTVGPRKGMIWASEENVCLCGPVGRMSGISPVSS